MSTSYHSEIEAFMNRVSLKNAHEPEFLQAVQEVAEAVIPFVEENPKYK
jgi:glutamate dehydrogenase (NADP+)